MHPTAIVMNMFYTGLGIARSLGEKRVPVIGLTAQHGIYGNYTRYAKVKFSPDSRHHPTALLTYLLRLGKEIGHRSIIFPTRDDDVLFLDRYREELNRYFLLAVPESPVVEACLNKWQTYLWAQQAGVPTPRCWTAEGEEDLHRIVPELTFPCVLKPVSSLHWRKNDNWQIVGSRKAVSLSSAEQLFSEYASISRADKRVLLQEMVAGSDDHLLVAACYLDRHSNLLAGFTAQKLAQAPEGFGTGFIIQTVDRPELLATAVRLLQHIRFTGIAEVEFKWDSLHRQYQLIEVNPRPWDQHRLSRASGFDLIYTAYCDYVRLALPSLETTIAVKKWVAEDTFILTCLRFLWRRDRKLGSLFRLARGNRTYAIWSVKDPLPFLGYSIMRFIPQLLGTGICHLWSAFVRQVLNKVSGDRKGKFYENYLENGKSES